MTFYKWVQSKYGHENNQFGKLAVLLSDKSLPQKVGGKMIRKFLIRKKVDLRLMRAFDTAYTRWQKND